MTITFKEFLKEETLSVGDRVRILTMKKGSMNEFGRIESISPDGRFVFITNMNSPFVGTFSGKKFKASEVTKKN